MVSDQLERVQAAFETHLRDILQRMVNFTGGNPRVERMWVYTSLNHGTIQGFPFFLIDGQMVDHNGIVEVDSSREYDVDGFLDELPVMESADEFLASFASREDMPERIVTTYDPHAGRMESRWDHDGVLEGPDDFSVAALERWVESVKRDLGTER